MSSYGTYDNMLRPLLPGQGFPWLVHKNCKDPDCCLRKFWCAELRRMGFGCKMPQIEETSDSEKEEKKEEKATEKSYAASSRRQTKKAPAKKSKTKKAAPKRRAR